MKPYNERLPLIDAAIDYFIPRHGGYPSKCQYMVEFNPKSHAWCATACSGSYLFTQGEFTQRKAQWEKLYEWISSRNEEVKKRGFSVLFSMPKELLDDWIKEAEHWGCNWQDTLEERPFGSAVGTIESVEFSRQSQSGTIERIKMEKEFEKKKEQDMNNDWYGNGELPPVGSVVIFMRDTEYGDGPTTKTWCCGDNVEVISHKMVSGRLLPVCWNERSENATTVVLDCLRPLPTETDKLVEQIADELRGCELSLTGEQLKIISNHLIEQGYRKIKQMSEDEFVFEAHPMVKTREASNLYRAGCRFIDNGGDK